MVKWRRGAKQVELRTGFSDCIFCQAVTPQAVIRTEEAHRYYGQSTLRTLQVCKQCGGYRVLPDESDS
jgi:hypothetical protein